MNATCYPNIVFEPRLNFECGCPRSQYLDEAVQGAEEPVSAVDGVSDGIRALLTLLSLSRAWGR